LERCGGVMLPERHKRLTLRSGCTMHTKRHNGLHPKMRRHTTHRAPQRLTLFSRMRTTKAGTRSTKRWPWRRRPKPLQAWGSLHNLIGGSQVSTQPSRVQGPERNKLRVQAPKSNKLTRFTSTNQRGELKPMQLMQWQEHKCSNPSLPNSNKATNANGGIREEEQRRRITKNSKI